MKKALVTIATEGLYEQIGYLTHPFHKCYGEKLGADFIVWRDYEPHVHPGYKKLDISRLLLEDGYERVLFVDTDVLIRSDAPDLFAIVPEDAFGALNELPFQQERLATMSAFPGAPDPSGWLAAGKYFNTGVFVCSRSHAEVFTSPEIEFLSMFEQTYLNYRLHSLGVRTFDLDPRFNRMKWMDCLTGRVRHDAWFIHYAGEEKDRILTQIQRDIEIWSQAGPNYRFALDPLITLRFYHRKAGLALRALRAPCAACGRRT